MHLIGTLITGAIAGWLGGKIFQGRGLGIITNIVLGILGSYVGSWILGKAGISLGGGWLGAILTGAVGAIIILALVNLVAGKK